MIGSMSIPTRVAGVIVNNTKILLIHRKKSGNEYWVLPGGGLEGSDASPEAGLLREISEETTLEVKITRHIYTHDYTTSVGIYYLCQYVSGKPKLAGDSIEKGRMKENQGDLYKPVWVDVEKLSGILLYPLEIRDWLILDLKNGFPKTPRRLAIETKGLRKL